MARELGERNLFAELILQAEIGRERAVEVGSL
jgi:hypothetical protein